MCLLPAKHKNWVSKIYTLMEEKNAKEGTQPAMQYRHLGRAGVRVSAISLGSWLTYGGSVEEETAIQCIHNAYEQGITFFDTANAYNRGATENGFGRALKDYSRDPYVLATKDFFPMTQAPND